MSPVTSVISLAIAVQTKLGGVRDIRKDAQELSMQLAQFSGLLQRGLVAVDPQRWETALAIAPLRAMEVILQEFDELVGKLSRLAVVAKFFIASEALDSFSAGGRSLSTSLGELQTALHLDPGQPSTADLAGEFARVQHDLRDLRSKLGVLRAFREEALALAQTVRALERSGGEVGTSIGGGVAAASPRSSSGGSSHAAVGGDALVGPIQAAVRQAVKESLERQGIPLATLSAVSWERVADQLRSEVSCWRSHSSSSVHDAEEVAFLERVVSALSITRQPSTASATSAASAATSHGGALAAPSVRRPTHVPAAFCCPITRTLMRDPVVLADDMGHCFERAPIERWLNNHDTHPMTNLPLRSKEVRPAVTLRHAIEEWLDEHGLTFEQADELEARTESRRTSASMGLDAGHGGPARSRGPSYAGEQQQQQPAASSPHLSPLGPPTPTPSPAQPAGPVSDDVAEALCEACRAGNIIEVRRLLSRPGINPNVAKLGLTPLYIATTCGHTEIAMALVEAKALPDACVGPYGQTPLFVAAEENRVELVNALLRAGANKEAATQNGWTPLHAAAWAGRVQVVRALLAAGANTDAPKKDGRSPLNVAAVKGHVDVVRALLGAGANTESPDKYGYTPLHLAAGRCGKVEMVRALLAAGAAANAANKEGETPLYLAALQGRAEVVGTLLQHGADKNAATREGWTALHAAHNGEVARALVEAGANKEALNSAHATPLFVAAQQGRVEVVKVLVAAGASLEARNRDGETALQAATRLGRTQAAAVLQDAANRRHQAEQLALMSDDLGRDRVGDAKKKGFFSSFNKKK